MSPPQNLLSVEMPEWDKHAFFIPSVFLITNESIACFLSLKRKEKNKPKLVYNILDPGEEWCFTERPQMILMLIR